MTHVPPPQSEAEAAPLADGRDPLAQHLARLPRRTLAIALTLLPIVALANVAVLVWSLGGIDLSQRLVAPHLLVLAAVLVFVPMLANALRLANWSRFLGLGLGVAGSLRVISGAMVANSVTPSATGGMPAKVLLLMGEGVSPKRSISLISLQAAEDALVLFILLGLAIAFRGFALVDFLNANPALLDGLYGGLRWAALVAGGLIGALVLIGALIAVGTFGTRVRDWNLRWLRRLRGTGALVIGDWAAVVRGGKGFALVNLVLASTQWTLRFSIAGLVLAAFGTPWHPALYWLLQYLVQSLSSTVPTPGGAGGAEAAFLLLFTPFIEGAVLLPAMSAWRLLFFYLPLTGAAIVFFLLRRRMLRRLALPRLDETAPGAMRLPVE